MKRSREYFRQQRERIIKKRMHTWQNIYDSEFVKILPSGKLAKGKMVQYYSNLINDQKSEKARYKRRREDKR